MEMEWLKATIYPSPITLASSFNDQFAFQVGRETALEMRATGSHGLYSKRRCIKRS